jgi:hypothetical protein
MRRVQMDKRVQFDFEIKFTNGGGLKGRNSALILMEMTSLTKS